MNDDGDTTLNCAGAEHAVWLVKVPKYLANKWLDSSPGESVGKLKIGKSTGRTEVFFSLDSRLADEKNGDASNNIPVDHKFILQGIGSQRMCVISQTNVQNNPKVQEKRSVEGRVVQKAECRPQGGNKYMQLKKTQITNAMRPNRITKRLNSAVKTTFKPVDRVLEDKRHQALRKEIGKRSRGEKEDVMHSLFVAFEKHQYYNIKDLVEITKQPVAFVKEILHEIGNYNQRNPHKNMWELKPEYRHHEKSTESSEDMETVSQDG